MFVGPEGAVYLCGRIGTAQQWVKEGKFAPNMPGEWRFSLPRSLWRESYSRAHLSVSAGCAGCSMREGGFVGAEGFNGAVPLRLGSEAEPCSDVTVESAKPGYRWRESSLVAWRKMIDSLWKAALICCNSSGGSTDGLESPQMGYSG